MHVSSTSSRIHGKVDGECYVAHIDVHGCVCVDVVDVHGDEYGSAHASVLGVGDDVRGDGHGDVLAGAFVVGIVAGCSVHVARDCVLRLGDECVGCHYSYVVVDVDNRIHVPLHICRVYFVAAHVDEHVGEHVVVATDC